MKAISALSQRLTWSVVKALEPLKAATLVMSEVKSLTISHCASTGKAAGGDEKRPPRLHND